MKRIPKHGEQEVSLSFIVILTKHFKP